MRGKLSFGWCAGALAFACAAGSAWSSALAQVQPPLDIERGRHIANALAGCADCHGANFAGGRAFTRGGITVRAANLTPGLGGIGIVPNADIVRAIRAGIAPDGTPLRVMPSREYAVMTDADVADLVAFLRDLPPVDNVIARPAPDPPLTGGGYLTRIGGCTNCHGADFAGGSVPGGGPAAPNISHAGIGSWTLGDFTTAMRTGKTPDGRVLSAAMPWKTLRNMTDDELRAVYTYLQSQPGRTP